VTLPSRCGNSWMGNIRNHSGFQTFVNDRSVALSPAHQKQGPFPPPTLLGLHGCMTLSDFRAGHHPIDDVEGATFTNPDIPQLPRSPFWHAAPSNGIFGNAIFHAYFSELVCRHFWSHSFRLREISRHR